VFLNLTWIARESFAFEETFEILKDFSELKIYIHSRAYSEENLKKCEHTFPHLRIGINNIFTYPSAKIAREAVLKGTSAKLLIETDAPYLPPQSKRGEINYPHYCKYVYEKYCELT
jgi:TatD DNase family protein